MNNRRSSRSALRSVDIYRNYIWKRKIERTKTSKQACKKVSKKEKHAQQLPSDPHRHVIQLGEEFVKGLLGIGQAAPPPPADPIDAVDLTTLTSKALTCLLLGAGLDACKPKKAARRAIRRFQKLTVEDQQQGPR